MFNWGSKSTKEAEIKQAPKPYMNPSEEHEEKLLECVYMKRIRDYEIYDVLFPMEDGEIGSIHTIETGYENKEVLVLIHGYGSGAVFYYKLMAELRHTFHIYSIDMYGLGSSSRPKLKSFDFNHVVSFFVEGLEAWRQKLNLQNFVLMGHSMGGYISSHWVRLKNPPLKMLYLLSPAGFTNKTDEELKKQSGFFMKNVMMPAYDYVLHQKNANPFNLILFGKEYFIKKKFQGKRIGMAEGEAEAAAKYLASTLEKDECGEKAVGVLLRFAKYSSYPICQILSELQATRGLQYPISVIYGATDWMDFNHSIEMNNKLGLHLEIFFVPDCDHQIILQNPKDLAIKLQGDYTRGYGTLFEVSLRLLIPSNSRVDSRRAKQDRSQSTSRSLL